MKKVSIIIPMFNSKVTLDECLNSIVNQSIFNDLEVIIVDDASTDNSCELAEQYEQSYPDNILLIKLTENVGPGAARNIALTYASGKYIGFVDSDDAIAPTMYEELFDKAIQNDADFVDSGFYSQQTDSAILYTSDELAGNLDDKKRSELLIHGGYTVTKIFKHDFLNRYSIRFREVYVLEDFDFLAEIIARANRVSNVKKIFYIYRDRQDSLSKTVNLISYVNNHSEAITSLYARTCNLPNYPGIQDAIEFLIIRLYSYMINQCLSDVHLNKHTPKEVIPILNSIRNLKSSMIKHDYNNKYVINGISERDTRIIKANDISAEAVLNLLV